MNGKPTDNTIVLAAFLLGGDWYDAGKIKHAIGDLGFRMPSSQWITARLISMMNEQAPRFEGREVAGRWQYKVTHWAETGLINQFPGFMTKEKAERLVEARGIWEQAKAEREGQ